MEKLKKVRYKGRMRQKTIHNHLLMRRATIASIVTAISLIILKFLTFVLTGSMAMLSTLLDSIQDSMTSFINFIAVKQATEPADKEHRFGHGKAQALGSASQGIIIAIASMLLICESISRLFEPKLITDIGLGVFITAIAIVATFFLVRFQKHVVKKTNSLSIKTDMLHYTGDIFMNIGVIVSMLMSYYLKWTFVDSLFGIAIGIYLLTVVYKILKESICMLMDTEMPNVIRGTIKKIAMAHKDVHEIYDLKTRQSGEDIFIQFCIRLDKHLTLQQAHDITDEIEHEIHKVIPDSSVIIHPEPLLNKGKKS